MTKKTTANKKSPTKKEDLEDFEDDLFSSNIKEEYPDIESEEEDKQKEETLEEDILPEDAEEIQKIPVEEEKFYKYLNLKLKKIRERDYELIVLGQSHGFCNILIKYLLNVEGVEIAAYKSTTIEPSKVFIRLKNEYNIKKIISEGISLLEQDVIKLQKVFNKNF